MIALSLPLVGSIVGSIALFAVILWLTARKVKQLRVAARAEMERDVLKGRAPRRIDEMAQFFGVQSRGATQMRGNGCLALTSDELVFIQFVPRQTIRIPLSDVVEVDEAKSHLGKWTGRPLLRVRWRTAGVEDTIAWSLADVAGWLTDLRGPGSAHPRA